MNDPAKKPAPGQNQDSSEGGFSNLDDNIRAQQDADVEQEREEEEGLPDPTGQRHG